MKLKLNVQNQETIIDTTQIKPVIKMPICQHAEDCLRIVLSIHMRLNMFCIFYYAFPTKYIYYKISHVN